MLSKIVLFTFIFFTCTFIPSTYCSLPYDLQNLELDDITSFWGKLPLIIDKIKETINRFRCPKGWKRLGGSCYYFSNSTSTYTDADKSCSYFFGNNSNLIQIQNAVELMYAAHILTKYDLPSLMLSIDTKFFKGKRLGDALMNDQIEWFRMRARFNETREKLKKIKQNIIDRLNSNGLRILTRTKKLKPTRAKIYDKSSITTNNMFVNATIANTAVDHFTDDSDDEYEFDDIDSLDQDDEFKEIEDLHGICDQIAWNVFNENSTVYSLTKYILSDKIVCSLNDIEPEISYHYLCEYVLDFCFANLICGKHGHCVNSLTGFKCTCSFLYGGLLCEKLSAHGKQIIISIIIIVVLFVLKLKPVRFILWLIVKAIIKCCRRHCKTSEQAKINMNGAKDSNKKFNYTSFSNTQTINPNSTSSVIDAYSSHDRRPTIAEEIMKFILPKTVNPLLSPVKRNLARSIWVGLLSVLFLSLLFLLTTIMYFKSFVYYVTDDNEGELSINDTVYLVNQCETISDYRLGNLIFSPIALTLILIFSWSTKREKKWKDKCDGRPGLLPPIEPFRTGNRFTTATVFGIIAYEVLKIFEELLFYAGQSPSHGVLIELLERIAVVILVGLRYYPVLASLQLRNIVARFFACLYLLCDIVYTIVREGSCMGFMPLSGEYTAFEEAKLRRELGTWFIVYGLIKNIPHFFFLSYIGAELCVRFLYDSIYVPVRKRESIWSAPIFEMEEMEFAKYYVTKLFRRNRQRLQKFLPQNTNVESLVDHEHEVQQQNKMNQSRIKSFLDYIYVWDDDFRFTTMATCTYTVAFIFLYYLACTFVFLYISRTSGHIAFITFYIEQSAHVELKDPFSLKREIILGAVLTTILFGFQLFIGMQNYKKHKKQLFRGIYVDVPPAINFKRSSIASNSVHYSGFLVGYMAWGFVICFHVILLVLIAIRVISLQIRYVEVTLSIVVPILLIYFLKMLSITSAGKFLFIRKLDNKLNLKSRKTYAIFVYFSFFADCFLGMASCIIRLIKATFLNVIFMARLDWSFLGRPMEKFDLGFAAYVSYLHMEVTYTNPVMLAFCYSIYDDMIKERTNHCYDDECCIAPGELEKDEEIENRVNIHKQTTAKILNQPPGTVFNGRYMPSDNERNEQVNSSPSFLSESTSKVTSKGEYKYQRSSNRSKTIPVSTKTNKRSSDIRIRPEGSNRNHEGPLSDTSSFAQSVAQQSSHLSSTPEISLRNFKTSKCDTYRLDTGDDDDDDDDDDGALISQTYSIVEKRRLKADSHATVSQKSSTINIDSQMDEDSSENILLSKPKRKEKKSHKSKSYDDDDGLSKQIIVIMEEREKPLKIDIGKVRQTRMHHDSEHDDDSKQLQKFSKNKSSDKLKQQTSKSKSLKQDYHTEHDDSQISDNDGSTDDASEHTTKSSKHLLDTSTTSHDTIDHTAVSKTVIGRYKKINKATNESSHRAISKHQSSAIHLRTISYLKAQQSTSSPTPYQSNDCSIDSSQQKRKEEDDSYYSEIVTDMIHPSYANPSYSKVLLTKNTTSRSSKPLPVERQEQKEDTGHDTEESEEDEETHDETQLLKPKTTFTREAPATIPDQGTDNTKQSNDGSDKDTRRKKRRLRFRWHFLYTIIRNYHLFDLRKGLQVRLAQLHLQKSIPVTELQLKPADAPHVSDEAAPTPEDHATTVQKSATSVTSYETTAFDEPSVPPLVTHRAFSVPASSCSDYPQSPAERYVANRVQMLYDANNEQTNTANIQPTSQTSVVVSSVNQTQRNPMLTTVSGQSFGFHVKPEVTVHPASDLSTSSKTTRTDLSSTPSVMKQQNTPQLLFQPGSTSNQSTADYPLAASSIINSSTFCSQMSHDQHMQTWHQHQIEKIQRKRRYCYNYNAPRQPMFIDRVSTATILTPQILHTAVRQQSATTTPGDKTQRAPTVSPFKFPIVSPAPISALSTISDVQNETHSRKMKKSRQQRAPPPTPPKRMDRLDEDTIEILNLKEPLASSSVLINRADEHSSTSDTTEV